MKLQSMYIGHEKRLANDLMRQEAITLNLQRVCEASVDLGIFIVKTRNLGIPNSAREVFELLRENNILSNRLCKNLQNMINFRNIAIHDHQKINLAIIHSILENRLSDFKQLIKAARNL